MIETPTDRRNSVDTCMKEDQQTSKIRLSMSSIEEENKGEFNGEVLPDFFKAADREYSPLPEIKDQPLRKLETLKILEQLMQDESNVIHVSPIRNKDSRRLHLQKRTNTDEILDEILSYRADEENV